MQCLVRVGLQIVFTMCPSTPQSVTSAVYNFMISVGSLFSLGILALTAYQWGWYPRAGEEIHGHYLGNDKVAYYYWLLAGVMLVTAFWTLVIGCNCDLGLNRDEIKHQLLVNEEPLPNEQLSSADTVSRVSRNDTQTREFVELS